MAKVRSNEYYMKNAHRIVGHLQDLSPAIYRTVSKDAKGKGRDHEVAMVAILLSGYPEILGYICGLIDMSRGERAANPLDRYKVVITRDRNEFVVGYPYSTKAAARESFSRLAAGLNPGEMIFLYFDGVAVERYAMPKNGMPKKPRRSPRKPNHHRTGLIGDDYPIDPYRADLASAYDPYDRYWRSPNGRRANTGGSDYEIYESDIPGRYSVVYVGDPKGRYRLMDIQSNGYGYEGGIKPREYASIKKHNRRLSLSDLPAVVRATAEKYMGKSRAANPSGRVSNPSKSDLLDSVGKMTRSYLKTAIWSETDPNTGAPLDEKYDIDSFSMASIKQAKADCDAFMQAVIAAGLGNTTVTRKGEKRAVANSPVAVGHDFWLTRCGHGAGFWDGDYEAGEELTEIAKRFTERGIFPSGKTLHIEHA